MITSRNGTAPKPKSIPTSDEPKTPDYSLFSAKQKRKQLTDNELAGHEKLASCGLDVKPIPIDRSAPASIDLYIDGELWELKTPTMTGGMLRKRINEGISKWRRLHEHGLMLDDYPRIVVDNRFCEMGDGETFEIIIERMGVHEPGRFDQAMLVRKDGILVRIWR